MENHLLARRYKLRRCSSSIVPQRMQLLEQKNHLRSAQADRQAFVEESQAIVKKQRSKIDFLVREGFALKDGVLSNFQKNFVRSLNHSLGFQSDAVTRLHSDIAREESRLSDVEAQIRLFDKQIQVKKKEIGVSNNAEEVHRTMVKEIKILENRLDKSNQKFNEMMAFNANLRTEIDSYQKEKSMFKT